MLESFATIIVEKDYQYAPIPPKEFKVDYYAITPKNSRARFQLRTNLTQIRGARSETAVLAFLKKRHNPCQIEIQSLEFV